MNIGKKPRLEWVHIDDLTINHNYQRSTETRTSQTLIKKIATQFHWSKFTPIIVAKADKKYAIIDGQHRALACLERGDITHVPASIVDEPQSHQQAGVFVDINKNRVSMSKQAQFYASIAAGDATAKEVLAVARESGVTILKYPKQATALNPGECVCVSALIEVYEKYGSQILSKLLTDIIAAYPDTGGQIRAMFIKSLGLIYHSYAEKLSRAHMIKTMADIDPESIQETAKTYRTIEGGTTLSAMCQCIIRKYNTGLKKENKLL